MKLLVLGRCEGSSKGTTSNAVGLSGANSAQDMQSNAGTAALDISGRAEAKRNEEEVCEAKRGIAVVK